MVFLQKVDFFQSTIEPGGPLGNFALFRFVCYGGTEGKCDVFKVEIT